MSDVTFSARRVLQALLSAAALSVSACAPKVGVVLPPGEGVPLSDISAAREAARASCDLPPALTVDLRVSGRIDDERVRGTLQLGVSGEALRLEGLAPFGAPVFVLAARPGHAVLLLPRDKAFARGTSAAELLDAVIGVALAPGDLRAVVAGCGLDAWTPVRGAQFGQDWTRLEDEQGRRLWIHSAGGAAPVVLAAEDTQWRIDYTRTGAGWPTAIRLRARDGKGTDAVFAVDAPERIDALPTEAASLDVPSGAREVTLDDLRRARGLRER